MNDEFLFKNQFISYIKAVFPVKIVSGGRELQCRCKYCSDSSDINNPGHMYIKIPQSPEDPILFHCFKCQVSGIVNSDTLLEWGIYNPEIAIGLDKNNSLAVKHKKYNIFSNSRYPFYNHVDRMDLANIKLNYINNRIGTNLSIKECLNQKIIFNLNEVVNWNKCKYTRHPNIVQQLNDNFVGFMSLDNNFINLRRICEEGHVYESIDKRYINYSMREKTDNTEKMYIMPVTLDLSLPIKIPIHIAEGPFDILSIRYNLRKNEDYGIFAAVTGSGYKGLIKHLITAFNIFYFDIHIYPDNDKYGNNIMINDLINVLKPYNTTVYEHRNIYPNEKDFGVPSNRIDEKIYIHS